MVYIDVSHRRDASISIVLRFNTLGTMNQYEIMLEFLRSAVLGREPVLSQNTIVDWDVLMSMASGHGIIAWVWDGVCKLPQDQQPPRQQRINWGLSAQTIWARYGRQEQLLNRLVDVCNQNNLRMVLLKGISLAELYPKPQSRPCGDIDIFVVNGFEMFNKLFIDNIVDSHVPYHTVLYFNDIMVENHADFLNPDLKRKKKINNYLKSTQNEIFMSEHGYYLLSPQAYLIFLTMHTMKHLYNEVFIPIRNVLDFAMFLVRYRNLLVSEECYRVLDDLRMAKEFELLICLAENILGMRFDEYHRGLISQKQILKLTNWMENDNKKHSEAQVASLGLCNYLNYLIKRRCLSRYVIKMERLFGLKRRDYIYIKNRFVFLMRAVFHVPESEHFKGYLSRIIRRKY